MAEAVTLTVEAGAHTRMMCPVRSALPWQAGPEQTVALEDADTGRPVPCQIDSEGHQPALAWVVSGLRAGAVRRYRARLARAKPVRARVALADVAEDHRVEVRIGGSLFTAYHYGREWVRPFLHPLRGPSGARMTRGWPIEDACQGDDRDHPHHKSLWVAHGECGKVDNWSEEPGHGWQRHRHFTDLVSGPVFGRIVGQNDWCTHRERKQFEEIRDMTFYATPPGVRLFDVAVTFRMTEGSVTFKDTKEGGLLSVRVASALDVRHGGRIENAWGGINEAETWGKAAPWCDYSGRVDGVHAGVAVMDHPANPRFPTGWHVRDYGLMTANCFASAQYRPDAGEQGDMLFPKESIRQWRYRVLVHRGGAAQGRVAGHYLNFAFPPTITVE